MGVTGVLRICFKDNEVIRKRQTLDKPQHCGLSPGLRASCSHPWLPPSPRSLGEGQQVSGPSVGTFCVAWPAGRGQAT